MTAAVPYGVYDSFAWCYSQGWGVDYHRQARPALEHHVFPRIPPGGHVLDLCCGTGDLSSLLLACGFRVTGIDGSAEMLRFARERVPGAEFLLQDARAFEFDFAFDAVLSTFDSLNHIVTLNELEAVFRNVYQALAPGGLFVFDLNMEESFQALWCGSTATVEETYVSITRGSYDPEDKMGRADVTLFRLAGDGWRRFDITVFERCYSLEEVTCGLERLGFTDVAARDAHELGMCGDVALGRAFFFAIKPSAGW